MASARSQVIAALAGSRSERLEVDARGIDRGDTSGMSLLYEMAHGRLSTHLNANVTGLRPEFQPLLAVFPSPGEIDALEAPPVRRSVFEEIGEGGGSVWLMGIYLPVGRLLMSYLT